MHKGAPNSSGEGVAYHGFSAKNEEVEIDHVNYYQAVDNYFKNEFPNEENLPLYLFALPENQTLFKKIAKQVTSKKMLVLRHRLLHYPHNKLPSVRKS